MVRSYCQRTYRLTFISKLIDRGKECRRSIYCSPEISFFHRPRFLKDSPNVNGELKVRDIVVGINGAPITYYDEAEAILGHL